MSATHLDLLLPNSSLEWYRLGSELFRMNRREGGSVQSSSTRGVGKLLGTFEERVLTDKGYAGDTSCRLCSGC